MCKEGLPIEGFNAGYHRKVFSRIGNTHVYMYLHTYEHLSTKFSMATKLMLEGRKVAIMFKISDVFLALTNPTVETNKGIKNKMETK